MMMKLIDIFVVNLKPLMNVNTIILIVSIHFLFFIYLFLEQNIEEFNNARRWAQRLLDFCDRLDERTYAEKQSVISDVYSRLGNAYLELGDYNKSLEYHNRDLRIAEAKQFNERASRALDNLGRVYARSGQFPQAIQVWERKIPLATSSLEKAWLFHEIGQCHFGLGMSK